jgi:hypothetical protein
MQLPSFLLAKEKVDQRSPDKVGRVSKYAPCIYADAARRVDSPEHRFARSPCPNQQKG